MEYESLGHAWNVVLCLFILDKTIQMVWFIETTLKSMVLGTVHVLQGLFIFILKKNHLFTDGFTLCDVLLVVRVSMHVHCNSVHHVLPSCLCLHRLVL